MKDLIEKLQQDQEYHRLEQYESEFKKKILDFVSVGDVRAVVESSHTLGLLLKYKPYGVKCASPLGYSIFLLNPGEGFSFQQHLDFKTELFHFIHVPDDGYGFIAESEDFDAIALQHSIKDWWEGKHQAFDKYKLLPESGHVAKVARTGIIHTVIGCVIEEYANTSLDMVDRIFDQNIGRGVKLGERNKLLEKIRMLDIPIPSHELGVGGKELAIVAIPEKMLAPHVLQYVIHENDDFSASRIAYDKDATYDFSTHGNYFTIFVSHGSLSLTENSKDITLTIGVAETVILPPESSWRITALEDSRLSLLGVESKKAFL